MELEYNDDRRKGRFIILAGVVLGLVAGGFAFYTINRAQTDAAQPQVPLTTIVVANADLPAREPIAVEQVSVRQVPVDDTNRNGEVANAADIVGRVPLVSILQGQPITLNLLTGGTTDADGLAIMPDASGKPDPTIWRAVAISVPDDLAVGGLIKPGRLVDVFVTAIVSVPTSLADKGTFYSDQSTKLVYQDVLVLAREGTYYIVRASLEDAEEITHLASTGSTKFSLALRADTDDAVVDTQSLGTTTNEIIEKYGLPIPKELQGGARVTPPTASPSPSPSDDPSAPAPQAPDASASPLATAIPSTAP